MYFLELSGDDASEAKDYSNALQDVHGWRLGASKGFVHTVVHACTTLVIFVPGGHRFAFVRAVHQVGRCMATLPGCHSLNLPPPYRC
jgi:cytosine/adenosine deaminase-related metal-dependent hydrolase